MRLKEKLKGRNFSSDAEVIPAAETWLDGKHSEFFLSDFQKLEFGRCGLFPPGRAKDLSAPSIALQKMQRYNTLSMLYKEDPQ